MDSAFERAFVAASYLLGERGHGFEGWSLGSDARSLLDALGSADRETRIAVLAREVARIAMALEKGSLA